MINGLTGLTHTKEKYEYQCRVGLSYNQHKQPDQPLAGRCCER